MKSTKVKLIVLFALIKCTQSINKVPIGDKCVELGWDLVTEKAIAYDSYQCVCTLRRTCLVAIIPLSLKIPDSSILVVATTITQHTPDCIHRCVVVSELKIWIDALHFLQPGHNLLLFDYFWMTPLSTNERDEIITTAQQLFVTETI